MPVTAWQSGIDVGKEERLNGVSEISGSSSHLGLGSMWTKKCGRKRVFWN